jgi:hypothetical protein
MKFIKKQIGRIDRKLFGGRLNEKRLASHRKRDLSYGFTAQYKKCDSSLLNILCDKYGSDKGEANGLNNPYVWPSHNYADVYELMFRLRRNDVGLVVECGLGTNNPDLKSSMGINGKPGASLRVWRDYFPNATVLGLDIDSDVLFSEDRIDTYYCDQTDSKSIAQFADEAQLKESSVDIIIDDGLHEFFAGKAFFEGMIKYLSIDGTYVIEDVKASDLLLYKDYFLAHSKEFSVQFFTLARPNLLVVDNRLIIVRRNA